MEKYFCNYNQSLALKELGFKKPCFGWYEHSGNFYYCYQEGLVPPSPSKKLIKNCCLAPLKSQVFEWFRDKHELVANWLYDQHDNYGSYIGVSIKNVHFEETIVGVYKIHEEAESACIDKLIEILQHDK